MVKGKELNIMVGKYTVIHLKMICMVRLVDLRKDCLLGFILGNYQCQGLLAIFISKRIMMGLSLRNLMCIILILHSWAVWFCLRTGSMRV